MIAGRVRKSVVVVLLLLLLLLFVMAVDTVHHAP